MVIRSELSWQYNGTVPMSILLAWCREHLDPVYAPFETIYFSSESDRTAFLLKWS